MYIAVTKVIKDKDQFVGTLHSKSIDKTTIKLTDASMLDYLNDTTEEIFLDTDVSATFTVVKEDVQKWEGEVVTASVFVERIEKLLA